MSKILVLLLMAFIIYLFISVGTTAKSEMVKATIAIPQKTAGAISNLSNAVEKSLGEIK